MDVDYRNSIDWLYDLKHEIRYDEQCDAIDIAIECIGKQIPKKPKPIYIEYGEERVVVSYNCINCGLEVGVNYADGHKIREHHCHCGQKIDWEDE